MSGPVQTLLEAIRIRTPQRGRLHDAAKEGNLADVSLILEEPGCQIDGKQLGFAASHLAAKGGHLEVLALLLDRGSDIQLRGANGYTPLHCAAECNAAKAITLLLARGADLHDADTANRDSALHVAALNGRLEATKLLVARAADVHAKNKLGNTPKDDATQSGAGRCRCEDPTAREWGACAAFLAHVMPLAESARLGFARRAWERPEAALLHDAAELVREHDGSNARRAPLGATAGL